jgi:hypothetical protein
LATRRAAPWARECERAAPPSRPAACRSIVDLRAAINSYIAEHNDDPKPFAWTQPADEILAKVNRLNASLH